MLPRGNITLILPKFSTQIPEESISENISFTQSLLRDTQLREEMVTI